MEFLGAKVIDEDMEGEHVFNGVDREVFGEEGWHGGIVHGEDSDGEAAVYLRGEVRDGEIVIEGRELRVLGKYLGDIVCVARGE